jgi:hypothetical protein
MSTHTLSLTRWHKVDERLNALVKEQTQMVTDVYNQTSISYWHRRTADKMLQVRSDAAVAAFTQIELELEAIATIRKALARKNAELGIADLLADVEVLNRRIGIYKVLLAGQGSDMVDPDALASLPDVAPGEDSSSLFGRRPNMISVRMLPLDQAEGMQVELRELQAQAHALLDEISDRNKEKITLELPDEIARLTGLAS